jgi:predicted hotdog family 3-hydroxylacyl-ACP dehydratase
MLIDKPEIARLIPHAGAMCLLDGVLSWDPSRIRCATVTHRSLDNPLRRNDRLGILCGVEYAAQAMALHAALAGGGPEGPNPGGARRGYLASLRAVSCHQDRLDLVPGTLIVAAERLYGEAGGIIYRFALSHQERILLDGRAAVVLEA